VSDAGIPRLCVRVVHNSPALVPACSTYLARLCVCAPTSHTMSAGRTSKTSFAIPAPSCMQTSSLAPTTARTGTALCCSWLRRTQAAPWTFSGYSWQGRILEVSTDRLTSRGRLKRSLHRLSGKICLSGMSVSILPLYFYRIDTAGSSPSTSIGKT
jgi:hypothetical protein